MKLEQKELKKLIKVFLQLTYGIHRIKQSLATLGVEVIISDTSPLDLNELVDFILDMFDIPLDQGVPITGKTPRFHRDWFYTNLYKDDDIDLTEETILKKVDEFYGILYSWNQLNPLEKAALETYLHN